MKKLSKILSVVMVALMLVCTSTSVFALSIDTLTGSGHLDSDTVDKMATIGGSIVEVITNVAMIVAVVIVAVLGVKYMIGSAEERAEYKKSMLPYMVGAVLVFGAGFIAKMVVGFGQNLK